MKRTNWKKGCTGKIRHDSMLSGRRHAHQLFKAGYPSQVYKCNHCTGYHVTTSLLRRYACPSRDKHSQHLLKRRNGLVYCSYCALHVDTFRMLTAIERQALKRIQSHSSLTPYLKNFAHEIANHRLNPHHLISEWQEPILKHLLSLYRKHLGAVHSPKSTTPPNHKHIP